MPKTNTKKKLFQSCLYEQLLSNFYITVQSNEEKEEKEDYKKEDMPIITIDNIEEEEKIHINFDFKKPTKMNKYETIIYLSHSFAVFARNQEYELWNLVYYKEDEDYTYSNFENMYRYYKWVLV